MANLWIAIRLAVAAVLLRRLVLDALKARRRELPVTRLIVPGVVLVLVLVANHTVPRPVAVAALLAVDVALFALCFGLIRSLRSSAEKRNLEQRIEEALLRFFPFWFARFAATDITIAVHALAGVKAFIDPGRAESRSYIHGSKIAIAGAIVALSVVPDAFLFWILLPHRLWWLALLLDVLDVWAVLWLFGIYGTMARRPHSISSERVILRNGILQSVELQPLQIRSVRSLGIVKRFRLPRKRADASAVLTFGGVPVVEITLDGKAVERNHLLPAPRHVERIFVASDAPEALCSELAQVSAF